MKTKNLVLKIISVILSVVAFISMAFPFVLTMISRIIPNHDSIHSSQSMLFSDWITLLGKDSESLWGWKTARVIMIILFIVLLLIIIGTVLQFFMKNKYVDMAYKYLSIAGIVLAGLFIVFFIIGCVLQFGNTEFSSVAVFPHAGSSILGVSSLISSILSLVSLKEKK